MSGYPTVKDIITISQEYQPPCDLVTCTEELLLGFWGNYDLPSLRAECSMSEDLLWQDILNLYDQVKDGRTLANLKEAEKVAFKKYLLQLIDQFENSGLIDEQLMNRPNLIVELFSQAEEERKDKYRDLFRQYIDNLPRELQISILQHLYHRNETLRSIIPEPFLKDLFEAEQKQNQRTQDVKKPFSFYMKDIRDYKEIQKEILALDSLVIKLNSKLPWNDIDNLAITAQGLQERQRNLDELDQKTQKSRIRKEGISLNREAYTLCWQLQQIIDSHSDSWNLLEKHLTTLTGFKKNLDATTNDRKKAMSINKNPRIKIVEKIMSLKNIKESLLAHRTKRKQAMADLADGLQNKGDYDVLKLLSAITNNDLNPQQPQTSQEIQEAPTVQEFIETKFADSTGAARKWQRKSGEEMSNLLKSLQQLWLEKKTFYQGLPTQVQEKQVGNLAEMVCFDLLKALSYLTKGAFDIRHATAEEDSRNGIDIALTHEGKLVLGYDVKFRSKSKDPDSRQITLKELMRPYYKDIDRDFLQSYFKTVGIGETSAEAALKRVIYFLLQLPIRSGKDKQLQILFFFDNLHRKLGL